MATVTSFPPNGVNRAKQQAVPGARATPGVVGALSGSERVGPEAAGALILLHTTFASDEGAQRGYHLFTEMKTHMLASPGFLHWFTFSDGPNGYALGLWRTPDQAEAFVRSDAHQAMASEQRERPFEYSQFAGMWSARTPRHPMDLLRAVRAGQRCTNAAVLKLRKCSRRHVLLKLRPTTGMATAQVCLTGSSRSVGCRGHAASTGSVRSGNLSSNCDDRRVGRSGGSNIAICLACQMSMKYTL